MKQLRNKVISLFPHGSADNLYYEYHDNEGRKKQKSTGIKSSRAGKKQAWRLVPEFEKRLKEKEITLKIGGSTVNALSKAAYKPEMGAREIRRILADRLEYPLVESIVCGKINNGQTLKVTYDGKKKLCKFEVI